jgi:hypothetical protein
MTPDDREMSMTIIKMEESMEALPDEVTTGVKDVRGPHIGDINQLHFVKESSQLQSNLYSLDN